MSEEGGNDFQLDLEIECIVDDYDLAWLHFLRESGTEPNLDDCVNRVNELAGRVNPAAITSLVCIALARRWEQNATSKPLNSVPKRLLSAEHYLLQFSGSISSELEVVLAEYRARRRFETRFDLTAFLERYSHIEGIEGAVVSEDFQISREAGHEKVPQLPGYEVLAELGRGGHGIVYKAWDSKLRRYVALKVLRQQLAFHDDDRKRFRREGLALAKLKHPGVVNVFAIEEIDGMLVMVLEFVNGESLEQLLRTSGLSTARICQVLIEVGLAIEHAHNNGILHRDLKPANILVDESGFGRVTDFGLAKQGGGETISDSLSLSKTNQILGTPSYMAPEQIDGTIGTVGPASDVYALGATLYAAMVGRPPFSGTTALETLQLVLDHDCLAPRRLNHKIPKNLETICMHCLGKTPASRYGSALEVVEDLRRFQTGESISVRPESWGSRVRRYAIRRPRESALWATSIFSLILLIAVAVTSAIGYSVLYQKEAKLRMASEAALERSESSKYVSLIQQTQLQNQVKDLAAAEDSIRRAAEDVGAVDRRDWEWYYLQNVLNQGSFRLEISSAEAAQIQCLAVGTQGAVVCGTSVPWYESMRQLPVAKVHYWEQGKSEAIEFDTAGNVVSSVAISPSGKLVAAIVQMVDRSDEEIAFAASYSELTVLDIEKRVVVWKTQNVSNNLIELQFSLDGNRLFSLSKATFRVWNAASGELLWHRNNVAAFRASTDRIILGSPSGSTEFEQTSGQESEIAGQKSGKLAPYVTWRDMSLFRNSASVRGRPAYSVSPDGSVEAFDEQSQVVIKQKQSDKILAALNTKSVTASCFHPHEPWVITGDSYGGVRIFDYATQSLIKSFWGHASAVHRVAFSPDGSLLCSGDLDGRLLIWDSTAYSPTAIYGTPGDTEIPLEAFAVQEGTNEVVGVRAKHDQIVRWSRDQSEEHGTSKLPSLIPQIAPGRSAAMSGNGRVLAFVEQGSAESLRVQSLVDDESWVKDLGSPVQFVSAGLEGNLIGVAAWKRSLPSEFPPSRLRIWDSQGNEIFSLDIPERRIWRLALDEAERRVMAVLTKRRSLESPLWDNIEHQVVCWDIESASRLWTFDAPADSGLCLGLAVDSSGKQVAVGNLQGWIGLLRAETGKLAHEFEGQLPNLEDLCFSLSGKRLAATSRTKSILWETQFGQAVMTLTKPKATFDPIHNPQVRFSLDGNELLTNLYDSTLKAYRSQPLSH